jgi:hypothetical protein
VAKELDIKSWKIFFSGCTFQKGIVDDTTIIFAGTSDRFLVENQSEGKLD